MFEVARDSCSVVTKHDWVNGGCSSRPEFAGINRTQGANSWGATAAFDEVRKLIWVLVLGGVSTVNRSEMPCLNYLGGARRWSAAMSVARPSCEAIAVKAWGHSCCRVAMIPGRRSW